MTIIESAVATLSLVILIGGVRGAIEYFSRRNPTDTDDGIW
jgi:hypothetical protein